MFGQEYGQGVIQMGCEQTAAATRNGLSQQPVCQSNIDHFHQNNANNQSNIQNTSKPEVDVTYEMFSGMVMET